MRDLETLRNEIDKIDSQLLPLFLERMDLCREVAEYKRSVNMPVLDRERERAVLENKIKQLPAPGRENEVYEFFSGIMSISRDAQNLALSERRKNLNLKEMLRTAVPKQNPMIAYQGTEGAYSEEAAIQHFGADCRRFHTETWEEACRAVHDGRADYAVLPIENSYTGAISDVIDLLGTHNLYIVGETAVAVRHCLLAIPGTTPEEIKTVYSHEQGILQCREFLKTLPGITCESCLNTAVSAKMVAESGSHSKAAIASKRNAELYGLEILAENINFSSNNTTRFVIVGAQPEINEECNKISIAFTLPHESGTLYGVLAAFAHGGLNLMKIESRPIHERNFEYMFYVDFTGSLLDEHTRTIMENILGQTVEFKLLGNYKAGVQL